MIDHIVGVDLQVGGVRINDQALQFGSRAEPGRNRPLLFDLSEIPKIIRIVPHRHIIRGLVRRRQPQRGEPGGGELRHLAPDMIPPLKRLAFDVRAIPIKRLHHDAHRRPSAAENQ